MVGDYISTSYGSDNLAHGVFATASAPTSGTSVQQLVARQLREPMDTFVSGLAAGSASSADDPVLFSGNGGASAQEPVERGGQQRQQASRLSSPAASARSNAQLSGAG